MGAMEYSERIVVYLDILGFSSLVKKSVDEPDTFNAIYKALSHFIEEKERNKKDSVHFGYDLCQYSTQSDCIVISYPFYKTSGSFFNILTDVYFLIAELSYLKIIVRGGMSIGKLYHDDQNVFGPALIEAVELEENTAHYPRVIISDANYNKGIEKGYLYSSEDEKEYINKRLKRDVDGFWYVDFFEQKSEFDWVEDFEDYMGNWKNIITKNLIDCHDNLSVYSKYCWLASKFNFAVVSQKLSIEKIKI